MEPKEYTYRTVLGQNSEPVDGPAIFRHPKSGVVQWQLVAGATGFLANAELLPWPLKKGRRRGKRHRMRMEPVVMPEEV